MILQKQQEVEPDDTTYCQPKVKLDITTEPEQKVRIDADKT